MVVPIESRQERKPVFFIKEGRQETLKSYLAENCRQLLGSDVFYDCGNGDLYFITWRDLPIEEGLLPPQYHLVSRLHPRADIYAPYTRFEPRKMVIRKVRKDGGAVEVAIRSFDHILEGVKGKEMSHVGVVKQRASELLDLFFQKPFTEITDEEFELARQKTYQMLAKVGFDPERVLKREKQRMGHWLPKGSFGRDSTGKRNWLISVCALQAAYRTAIVRERALEGDIAAKYICGREALIMERDFSRALFMDVADQLRPEALPACTLFKYPTRLANPQQMAIVSGMIGTMIHQLTRFLHVKAYKTVGLEAAPLLQEVKNLLSVDKREQIVSKGLFPTVETLLREELERHKDIYS